MPITTPNYGWTLPDAGAEPYSWEPIVRAAFQAVDATMHTKANLSGATFTGNVGVGAAAAAWSGYRALHVGAVGSIASSINGQDVLLGSNVHYDGSNNRYTATGYASRYGQFNGEHYWDTAPSGSAGAVATLTTRMKLDINGNLGLGVTPSAWGGTSKGAIDLGAHGAVASTGTIGTALAWQVYHDGANWIAKATSASYGAYVFDSAHKWLTASSGTAGSSVALTQAMALDASGNLLVGTSSGSHHTIRKNVTADAGVAVLEVAGSSGATIGAFFGVSGYGANAANSAFKLGKDNTTGRSMSVGGTAYFSGADYAEYRKNNGLTISKGQIVGYKTDGTLTLTWSQAILAGVKSTDPCIVGGDVWGTEEKVGARPIEPKHVPPNYTGRARPDDFPPEPQAPAPFTLVEPTRPGQQAGNVEAAIYALAKRDYDQAVARHAEAVQAHQTARTAWVARQQQHERDMAAWRADQAVHEARTTEARNLFDTTTYPEYQRAEAAFEARLEAARQLVDRIAYCGIVPVNMTGATPGHYIIAAEGPNDTIIGLSVRRPTEDQWSWVVGRCLRVLPDGRAEIQVLTS